MRGSGDDAIMMGNQTGSQTVLVVAMGVVTTAVAVALHRHIGLPGPMATTAALAAYLLLVTGHALAWRRERRTIATPARGAQQRREFEPGRPMPREAHPQRAPQPQARGARPPMPPPMPAAAGMPPKPPAQPMPPRGPAPAQPQAANPNRAGAPPPLPAARPQPPKAKAPEIKAREIKAPEIDDDLHDFWSFRPTPEPAATPPAPAQNKGGELPPFVTGRVSAPAQKAEPTLPGPAPQRATTPPPPNAPPAKAETASTAPKQADVEVIQDAIKRLLEEVNAAEKAQTGAHGAPGASVDQAIEALRMTAGTMRAATDPASYEAPPAVPAPAEGAAPPPPLPPFVRGTAPGPRPQSAADAQARLMADAISAGRIDVTLEPILGLEDQKTRHYEVCVRLRDSDGNVLDVTPDGPDLRGTGLLPLFDGVRITRTAAIARRLEERGKSGSVFSAFSGESVSDEHFLGELAESLHQRAGIATQLVLSFTQSDVRGFSTPEWDSLADMRALGFRFALSHITDLDMDFEALAEQGFAFVKLDASVFLEGLPAPSGHLPSSDVCRHLAKHGLTLVVEHIDDEDKLARVFGFGVLLGQGQLFGGPRPVRADAMRTRGATVAA